MSDFAPPVVATVNSSCYVHVTGRRIEIFTRYPIKMTRRHFGWVAALQRRATPLEVKHPEVCPASKLERALRTRDNNGVDLLSQAEMAADTARNRALEIPFSIYAPLVSSVPFRGKKNVALNVTANFR